MLKEFRTDLVLTDLQTRQRVSDRMRIVYLQLPLFDKQTEAECMDIFDCWIYIVKNMNMFEQMPFSEKYPVFRKLAEIGDLRKLSREELEFYDEDIKNMRDIYATRKFDEKRLPGGSCIPRVAFSVLYSPLASHLAKKRSLTK